MVTVLNWLRNLRKELKTIIEPQFYKTKIKATNKLPGDTLDDDDDDDD